LTGAAEFWACVTEVVEARGRKTKGLGIGVTSSVGEVGGEEMGGEEVGGEKVVGWEFVRGCERGGGAEEAVAARGRKVNGFGTG
jgi:hypothetical protein